MASAFDVHYALLNAAQKQAVDHADGPMLVLAGAGTGKTQIIALRIAQLLRTTDTAPHNILCLTFTESGVAAMRDRLIGLIGEAGYHVRIATFHSLCNEIIQEHPEIFFVDAERQALSDIERVQLLQSIIDELPVQSALKPFGAPYFYLTDIARTLQTLKRENVLLGRYRELVNQANVAAAAEQPSADATLTGQRRWQRQQRLLARQQELGKVYEAYQAKLKEWARYDYEDMLLLVVEQFTANPDVLAEYQERYYYLLVDEYQDTNGAQNEIVRQLSSGVERPNVFAVGDDRQSIYRFQGASLENILYFQRLFGQAVSMVSLQDNYRSQQYILDAAEAVIQHNSHSLAKYIPELPTGLRAARDLPAVPITVARFTSRAVEQYWIAMTIQQLLASGVPAQEIAVLYRNHRDAEDFIELAPKFNIPIHVAAGVDVLTDPFVAQFIRLIRYVGLQGNDEELFHIMHFQFLNLPVEAVAQVTYTARQHKQWLFTACHESKTAPLRHFAEQVLQWRAAAHNQLLAAWFTQLLEESGWLNYVLQQPDGLEHLNRLNTLFAELKHLNRDQRALSLRDLFAYLEVLNEHSIHIEEQELLTKRQAVHCMTAHRAKGLEFSHVFIMQCVDKHWGNVPERSKLRLPAGILQFESEEELTAEKNEDERRLFYVALTRAKQQIYLSYAEKSDAGRSVNPSQFLGELPEELVRHADVTPVELDALPRLQTMVRQRPAEFVVGAQSADCAWLQDRLARYRMSATHYNDYLECPRKFYFEHIVQVPRAPNRAVGFGIAVHSALRDAAVEYNGSQIVPSLEFLLDRFCAAMQQQLLSKKDIQDSLAFGVKALTEYYGKNSVRLTQNQFPEHDFKPYHVNVGKVPLTGKVDALRLLNAQQKTVHVIDYKTGNPDNKSSHLAKHGPYHRQLLFYKLLIDGAIEFGHTALSGEIHFVQISRQQNRFIAKIFEFSDEDAAEIRADIQRVYEEIQQLKFLNPAQETLCGECAYCTQARS